MKKTGLRLLPSYFGSSAAGYGCGNGAPPADPTTSGGLSDPGEPREGGEIGLAVTQEPDFLDPYLAEAAGTKEILYNLFEGLVKLETDGSFSPSLAEEYEMAADGRSYRFKLRKGVKFHNGDEMTAEDVIYSLERGAGLLPGADTPLIPEFASIESVSANDAGDEVTVALKHPDVDLIGFLTQAIIPAGYEEQNTHPIGTGPFRFVEYKTQQHVIMEKFADYNGKSKPYLDRVTFRIVPSADAAMVDLQAGKIDIFPYLTMDKASLVEADYDLIETRSNMVQLWALNNKRAPFDDPNVRKALNLAIDKQLVIDTVTYGYGTYWSPVCRRPWVITIMTKLIRSISPMWKRPSVCSAAGHGNGITLKVTVPANYLVHVQTAEALAAQLPRSM